MGIARRHHLVSSGYLRAWADSTSRILYIDKAKLSVKLIGRRDAFVAPNFLTFQTADGPSDALETEFGRIETKAIPLVREYVDGADSGAHHYAVKAIAALHFARSGAIRGAYERLWQREMGEFVDGADEDEDLQRAFLVERGHAPSMNEMRHLAGKSVDEAKRANVNLVKSVSNLYTKTLEYMQPMHTQKGVVARPDRGELVVADSPVVVSDGESGSAEYPVALALADLLWFPLSPTVGVALTTEPEQPVMLDEEATWILNMRSWRYAARFLAARADSHVNRAFGYPGVGLKPSPSARGSHSDHRQ